MPKHIFCAECGTELLIFRKALPKQEKVIEVIEPHKCREFNECEFWPLSDKEKTGLCIAGHKIYEGTACTIETSNKCPAAIEKRNLKIEIVPIVKERPSNIDKLFNSFKFVQKLNKLNPNIRESKGDDKRDTEFLREEIQTSSAPAGIMNAVKSTKSITKPNTVSIPDNEGGYDE